MTDFYDFYEVGDVVVLKSGGPKMTVGKLFEIELDRDPRIGVAYFEGSVLKRTQLDPRLVRKAGPGD